MAPGPVVLYVSFTGVMEGLGRAQVLEPLLLLARRGFRYELISFERENDLQDAGRLATTRSELLEAGIEWTALRYRGGGSVGHATNIRDGLEAVLRRCRRRDVALIHARGYLAGMLANVAKRVLGVPYLFDARGYWFDERREAARQWSSSGSYHVAKRVERLLYGDASAVVMLTELAAEDVRGGMFGRSPVGRPVLAITTCVDYQRFDRGGMIASSALPGHWPNDALVVGLVGSVNASYDLDASLALFCRIRQNEERARLLVVSRQKREFQALLRGARIADEQVFVVESPHDEMPFWLSRIHWGLLLLKPTFSKRASMPTKLAEFFASGVRPLARGCNAEVEHWVRKAGSGVVLPDLSTKSLELAACRVASVGTDVVGLDEAREQTRGHFSWDAGISRYAELLDVLGVGLGVSEV